MNGRGKAVRAWALGILAFLAMAIGAYAFILYGSPDGLQEQAFVTEKGSLPDLWYTILWGHAISAGVALAVGWLQFIKRLRHPAPNIHRTIGYLYSVMVVLGGITGLYLAYYADGGWSGKIGFGLLAVLWLYTLLRSLKSIIVEVDPTEHGRWMIRNYALSCAAITLRLYTGLADALFGLTDTNVTFIVIAWMAWVPNLLLAELLLSGRKPTKKRLQHRKPV